MTRLFEQLLKTILVIMLMPAKGLADSVYETEPEFLARAFGRAVPAANVLWLSGERKMSVTEILGHPYSALRVRYWCQAGNSAWILDEIGKEQPITVGIIVDGSYIRNLRVLTYRENRGGEVASPAFTDQFAGVSMADNGSLSSRIDSISGATLSVNALTRLANMALYLHNDSGCNDDPEQP